MNEQCEYYEKAEKLVQKWAGSLEADRNMVIADIAAAIRAEALARTSHDGIILRAASRDCTIRSMIRSTRLMATATEPAI